jgi:hypothetical protein
VNRYEQKGEDDARRGITVCDLDDPGQRRHWARGHDRTVNAGLGPLPRFGLICRRVDPRPMDVLL